MPHFVPVLLLALATLLGLYLGFVAITEAPARSPAGFAAMPVTTAKQAETGPLSFLAQPKKTDDIFLGNDFSISADEKIEAFDLSGTVNSKSVEESRAVKYFITNPSSYDRIFAVLKISNTNNAGPIQVFINNRKTYDGKPILGKYTFEIDKDILEFENDVRIETSGGFLLTSSFYDFDFRLYTFTGSHAEYKFFIKDRSNRKFELSLSENFGALKILLNKKELFYGKPESFLSFDIPSEFFSDKQNVLEFLPESPSEFKIGFVQISKV